MPHSQRVVLSLTLADVNEISGLLLLLDPRVTHTNDWAQRFQRIAEHLDDVTRGYDIHYTNLGTED